MSNKPSSLTDPISTASVPVAVARLTLGAKQRLIAYSPFIATLSGFIGLAEMGLFTRFGSWGHLVCLLGGGALVVTAFRYGQRQLKPLTEAEVLRVVERASGLQHRPLQALHDKRVVGLALFWDNYQKRLRQQLAETAFHLPRPHLFAPRHWLKAAPPALALGLAALAIWPLTTDTTARSQLKNSFVINLADLWPSGQLDGWIAAPAYTREAPISLAADNRTPHVLEGSTLTLKINGGVFTPVATLNGHAWHFTKNAPDPSGRVVYTLELPVQDSGRLLIRQDGRRLGAWTITTLIDGAPQVAFDGTPTTSERDVLKVAFTATDDYGLTKLEAEVTPTHISSDLSNSAMTNALTLPFAVPPAGKNKTMTGFRYFDLTSSPWAGQEVVATLKATDGKNQSAESDPITFRLPERQFQNPISKALVSLRKQMFAKGLGAKPLVYQALGVLASSLEDDSTNDIDITGLMALRVAHLRSRFLETPDDLPPFLQLLWETAQHFEEGGSASTLDDLRRAEQALEDALANNADKNELQRRMQDLASALQRHLQQLQQQQQAQQQPQQGSASPQNAITPEDLANALDALASTLENGDKEQAHQMLSQLQQLMENLQSGGGGNGQPSPEQQARENALNALENLMQSQQQLMGDTQNQPQGQSQNQAHANAQQDLKQQLEELQQGLAQDSEAQKIPGLSGGQQSMDQAENALRNNQRDSGVMNQGRALQQLQEAARDMRRLLSQGNGSATGQRGLPNDRRKVDIPGLGAPDKARAILEELRKRASDPSRPATEREYLKRLLKVF